VSWGIRRQWLGACALACCALAGCGARSSLSAFVGASSVSGSGGLGSGGSGGGGAPATGGLTSSGGAGSGAAPATGGGGGGSGGQMQAAAIDYLKSSFPRQDDVLGRSVALSADGRTLAVGVLGDQSAAVGINGDPTVGGLNSSGAVIVFWHDGNTWTQEVYIKSPAPDAFDYFGGSVSLSADGDRLAVGAFDEDSSSIGIDGDPFDDSLYRSGAVFVFSRVGSTWTQDSYVKASNTNAGDAFGGDVVLSGDGHTLAVGANGEDSAALGPGGDQTNNDAETSGAVYVFSDAGSGFVQEAYLKASNTGAYDAFGLHLALSADGNTLVSTAPTESSAATGIDGDQDNDLATNSGAAYVFSRSGATWTQTAYLKASNTQSSHNFGTSVAISEAGDTIAVGAPTERGLSSGINGDQSSDSALAVGAVYVFSRAGSAWQQEAYVKASNPKEAYFGNALAFSGDGSSLLVGAFMEPSAAAGINGDQTNESLDNAGAAYLFSRGASGFEQSAYLKASNPRRYAYFGASVALDYEASTVVVCADGEDGGSPGVNGDQSNQSLPRSGAAYVFYLDE